MHVLDPWCILLCREFARQTNLGRLLESKGRELLGKQYRSPTESLPELQRWSVEHPEVRHSPEIVKHVSYAHLFWKEVTQFNRLKNESLERFCVEIEFRVVAAILSTCVGWTKRGISPTTALFSGHKEQDWSRRGVGSWGLFECSWMLLDCERLQNGL